MFNFFNIFKKIKEKPNENNVHKQTFVDFKLKFNNFQNLLSLNDDILTIITKLEKIKFIDYPIRIKDLQNQNSKLESKIHQIINHLNNLSDNKYPELEKIANNIFKKINEKLQQKDTVQELPFTIPFEKITRQISMMTGGKNAHLSELKQLGLPVPDGFAITTDACEEFINYQGLSDKIISLLNLINPKDMKVSLKICQEIHELIMKQPLPPQLEKAFLEAYVNLGEHEGEVFNIAVRSSAIGEDSEKNSFAGQYSSMLNVSEYTLFDAFRNVIASKYNLRAILYQINMGFKGFDIPMAVCCVKMVNAYAAGVLYTTDPRHPDNNSMIINAGWGLGEYVVEGKISPDNYTVAKQPLNIISKQIGNQNKMLICIDDIKGGIQEVDVPEELIAKQCLSDKQILELSNYALKVENYYKKPQDIEWVLARNNDLLIVQSRPLHIQKTKKQKRTGSLSKNHEVITDKGEIVCPGVASGMAYHIKDTSDIFNFPQGAVLIVPKASPIFSVLLKKAVAVITDIGAITGHLASVTRQFNVPAIFNTGNGTELIPQGQIITVDAYNGLIFKGVVQELLTEKEKEQAIKDKNLIKSPIYQTLSEILNLIVPLNLIDPKASSFMAKNCITLHDITRFAHEKAIHTMFKVSDENTQEIGGATKLSINIPLSIYIIDLGGGLKEGIKENEVTIDRINSIPMSAVLKGMTRNDLPWIGGTGIDLKGFASVLLQSALSNPLDGDRALGEESYFIVSKNYLNFNARLAYHFSTVDSYCSEITNNNYILFTFKGGAASLNRRLYRTKFIALVLEKLDFNVELNEDFVQASVYKYEQSVIEEKLDLLGRLMCFSRKLDMILNDEDTVNIYVNAFLNEDYSIHLNA